MRYVRLMVVLVLACAFGVAMYQVAKPAPELSGFMPEGAMLYVEAKDFGKILRDWNSSQQKQAWLKSDTLSVFSQSRLYGRLQAVQEQFEQVAGLKPDMNLLGDSSGVETAFAWYDIGKLEFLFVSHVESAQAMKSGLWQSRAKFEIRKAGNSDFYVRKNPETQRVVAFAMVGDYLVIGTKEDLVAGAVQLISGRKDRTVQNEQWYAKSIAAAGEHGDLRMVLNLTKIVPSSYFRTYWVQQNITDMKQYSSAVSDLHREMAQYREERVLLRNAEDTSHWTSASADDSKSVAELARLVPESTGFYKAVAGPKAEDVASALVAKVLAPHLGAAPADKMAPRVSLGDGQTGSESDLETRIDQAPAARTSSEAATAALDALLKANPASAMLVLHSSERTPDAAFVSLRACVVVRGTKDWDANGAKEAVKAAVRPGLTASELGVSWESKQQGGVKYEQFDGLSPITMATQGKLLVIANNAQDVAAVLRLTGTPVKDAPESYVAGFEHTLERPNYLRFVRLVDGKTEYEQTKKTASEPQFFSDNMASISKMYEAVKSEKIVQKDEGEMVLQTVTYEWSH